MTDGNRSVLVEANVLRSMWRHRLLIVLIAAVFAIAAVIASSLRAVEYAAEAGVLLEDPRFAIGSEASSARDEVRYVADQVAIMKSAAAVQRASQLTRSKERPQGITEGELRRETFIRTSEGSNYVFIRFSSSDPRKAQVGTNAVLQAYRELVRTDLEVEIKTALRRLDAAIAAAVQRLVRTPDAEKTVLPLLNKLRARRNGLQIDAQVAGSGVALVSQAGLGSRQGASPTATLIVALVLGSLVGIGSAYVLDGRASRRLAPQAPFYAPPLVEIPDFDRERLRSRLPVFDAPTTRSAEAFRFLAAIIGLPQTASIRSMGAAHAATLTDEARGVTGREHGAFGRAGETFDPPGSGAGIRAPGSSGATNRSVAFVSASSGDGTTTVAMNSALAAAQAGDRVLVLDGDLRGHGLTRFLPDGEPEIGRFGVTDMLLSGAVPQSMMRVETSNGGSLSLVEPGSVTLDAIDAIRADRIRASLESTRGQFDRVFIDLPPILDYPYTEALLSGADAVVVVASRRGNSSRLEQVVGRLSVIGVHPIGHVENFVPLHERIALRLARQLLQAVRRIVLRSGGEQKTTLFPLPQSSDREPTDRERDSTRSLPQEPSAGEPSVVRGR